jgi:hypothetical protein
MRAPTNVLAPQPVPAPQPVLEPGLDINQLVANMKELALEGVTEAARDVFQSIIPRLLPPSVSAQTDTTKFSISGMQLRIQSDADVQQFAHLSSFSRLEAVDISDNCVTAAGARAIAAQLSVHLESLSLFSFSNSFATMTTDEVCRAVLWLAGPLAGGEHQVSGWFAQCLWRFRFGAASSHDWPWLAGVSGSYQYGPWTTRRQAVSFGFGFVGRARRKYLAAACHRPERLRKRMADGVFTGAGG